MNKENLKEYAELKIKEKEISARLKELNPLVLGELIDLGVDKQPTTFGDFVVIRKKEWSYSPAVTQLQENLAAQKAEEEAEGVATFTIKNQLMFKEKKDE